MFNRDTFLRAVYTAAQVFIAAVAAQGVDAVDLSDLQTIGLSAAAAGLSVITSAIRAEAAKRGGNS